MLNRRPVVNYIFLLLLPAASAASGYQVGASPPYAIAELAPIAVQPDVKIPDSYVTGLRDQVAHGLETSKHFTRVVVQSDDTQATQQRTVKVECTVTKFVGGNRAERYFVGFGAGAARLTVHVSFIDKAMGKVLLEQDVSDTIRYGGIGGGSSASAQKAISKDIERIIKKNF